MAVRRLDAISAVPEVLASERRERIARNVARRHLRYADDPPPRVADPRSQLHVLVVDEFLVPATVLLERRASPDAGEAGFALCPPLHLAPDPGPASTEWRPKRQRYAP